MCLLALDLRGGSDGRAPDGVGGARGRLAAALGLAEALPRLVPVEGESTLRVPLSLAELGGAGSLMHGVVLGRG